jgi:ABC-2 type transport system permease protein
MKKILLIALNALRLTIRDRRALVMILVAPLIAIAILGNALSGLMTATHLSPFDVLVVNEDTAAAPPLGRGAPVNLGKVLTDTVLARDDVKRIIHTSEVTDLAQAISTVTAGKAVTVIHVPPNFSADMLAGRPIAVEMQSDPGRPTQVEIVQQIVRSFTDQITLNRVQATLNPTQLGAQLTLPQIIEVPASAKPVSAMQYYAAAMSIMFMVMTALSRGRAVLEQIEEGTITRMLTAPTSKTIVLSGQMLGTVVVLLAQFLVLQLGTTLLFKVVWGPWSTTLLIGVAFSVAAAGVGTAIAGLVNDKRAADSAVGMVGMLFSALSGGMFPIYLFSGSLKLIARFIPNYWALQGFLDQMGGAAVTKVWLPAGVLLSIGVVTGAIGTWRLASK